MIDGIPSSFECFGRTVTVRWVDALIDDDDGGPLWGEADIDTGVISLVRPKPSECVDPEMLVQVFWHETMHFILLSLNERELGYNESFVDQMAGCMHQFLKSAKYPRKRAPRKIARSRKLK